MIATIQGLGLISPWGETFNEVFSNYRRQASPLADISQLDRFESLANIKASKMSAIRDFNAKKYFKSKNMRKYNTQSRLGIAVSSLAIESLDSELNPRLDMADAGAVYANLTHSTETANFLRSMVNEGPENASPRNFPLSTPNAMACHVSTELGVTGPTLNICSRFSSGFGVLYNGVNLLRAGHVDHCFAVSVDYQTQVILELYSRFGAYKSKSSDNGCYPTDMAVSLILAGPEGSKSSAGYGNIIAMATEGSSAANYRFPNDWKTHSKVLRRAIGKRKVDKYLSSCNGISVVEELERKSFADVFSSGSEPEFVSLKRTVGEAGTMPLFQVIAALSEPTGHVSLVSVLGTGGIHGAVLIESTGEWEKRGREQKPKTLEEQNHPTHLAI